MHAKQAHLRRSVDRTAREADNDASVGERTRQLAAVSVARRRRCGGADHAGTALVRLVLGLAGARAARRHALAGGALVAPLAVFAALQLVLRADRAQRAARSRVAVAAARRTAVGGEGTRRRRRRRRRRWRRCWRRSRRRRRLAHTVLVVKRAKALVRLLAKALGRNALLLQAVGRRARHTIVKAALTNV